MVVGRRALTVGLLASAAAPAWCIALNANAKLDALVAAARAMFPHRSVPDATYRRVVAAALSGASPAARVAFAEAAKMLAGPAAGLEGRIASTFLMPGTQALRIATLIGLYSNPAVGRGFGYPGPSLEFGGYLDRGFGDLPWLPSPPPAWLP